MMDINPRKKILFVLQDLEIGGAEQLKLVIAKYINKVKFDTVFCCIRKIGVLGDEILKRGGSVISLNTSDSFFNLVALWRLYAYARKYNPDLIHSSLFNANFHSRLVAIALKKPVIIEEHGMYVWKRWFHKLIDRFLFNFTYKIIVPSESVKNFIISQEHIIPAKIEVIYNCVDDDKFQSGYERKPEREKLLASEDDILIGSVGTLRKEKGYDVLLEAMPEVLFRFSNAKLFLLGDGLLADYLKEKVVKLGIREQVIFLGASLAVPGFLKAIDLFVLPSISEGFGIALLEAVIAGVPSIASNTGGIREIAQTAGGVVLVEPNNSRELASAIINGLKNREKTDFPSPRTNSSLEVYTPGYYLSQLEKIYEKALV